MRTVALALLGAAAFTFSSAVEAAVTIDAGTTVVFTGPTTSGPTTAIGYSDATLASTFNESLVFTNTLAGLYSITLTTSSPDVNFTSAILSNAGGSVASLVKSIDDGTVEFWKLPAPVALASGQYTLNIVGQDNGVGSLGGSVTVSAVPEVGTWAMMLLGFGAMGAAMRRGRTRSGAKLTQVA